MLICHVGSSMVWESNFEIAIIPDSRIGVVQIYDTQKPEKFEKHTRGMIIRITFIDSSFKFNIPVKTNENINIGRIQTIMSFNMRLTEYKFDFISGFIYSPKKNTARNNDSTMQGKEKIFIAVT